ncbi:MAG: thioredoxin-disulfide reductase [bacterium]|nr:thioredoxin-disulfide reductase [bacterium]
MTDEIHELIIVGGGPAGLAAGIYAARDGLDCLLLEKGMAGGQIVVTAEVANYPGFPEPLAGMELARRMEEQARAFGLRIAEEAVTGLVPEGRSILLRTAAGERRARAVIVATGASYRRIGVPGEERLAGRGVSYCGTCDGPLFAGGRVVVVGGGDTAVEEALFIARFASSVTVVHRRDSLRAGRHLRRRASAEPKIAFAWNTVVREILGGEKVQGVIAEDVASDRRREIPCDGVFVFVGTMPNTGFLEGAVALDDRGYVVTDIRMRTSVPGVFAAGDVRADSVRQVASSVGDGVTALLEAECHLAGLEG